MTNLPEWAQPGCYGQALTYSDEQAECAACPFAATCKVEHLAAIARLREQHGIVIRPRTRMPPADEEAAPRRSLNGFTLPKKVEELLTRIDEAGIKVCEALAKGKNPFGGAFRFMRVTSHLLLHAPAGVTREHLITAFESYFQWSRGTAAAHATQAFTALKALGAAQEQNGRLILKR